MGWLGRLWTSLRGTCGTCGRKLIPATLPAASGEADGITVTFRELPHRACPSGYHDRRLVSQTFLAKLGRRLLHSGELPVASAGPEGEACVRCRQPLGDLVRHDGAVGGTVTLGELPSFGMSVAGLTVRCPSCGFDQLAIDLQSARRLSRALHAALREGGVEP